MIEPFVKKSKTKIQLIKISRLFIKRNIRLTFDYREDLILFKKALYLLKINDKESGIEILSNLIKKDSKLKILAQEIISK